MVVAAARPCRILVCLLIASASYGFAAGLIAQALLDLETYLKAASRLVVQVATGLEEAELEALPQPDRLAAARQLQALSDDLRALFIAQTNLVHNLEFYVKIARDPARTPAERGSFWDSSILDPAREVYRSVDEVRRFVGESEDLFSVTLSGDENRALGDNLMARGRALKSFEEMPAPATAEEILQLEGLVSHYKVLIENLGSLRAAVDASLRRLKDA